MKERSEVCPTRLKRSERSNYGSGMLDIQKHIRTGDALFIEVENGPGYLFIVRDLVKEAGFNFPVGDLISDRFYHIGRERIKNAVLACGHDAVKEYSVLARGLKAEFVAGEETHLTPPVVDCYFQRADRASAV